MIDSVILCGGNGTRLYPETRTAPKALVRVGRRPILDWVLGQLVSHGSRRVVLCAGFRADDIRDHARSLSIAPPVEDDDALVCQVAGPDGKHVELVVSDTGVGTLTGARVHRVERLLRGDALITYSDVLADVSIPDLVDAHRSAGAAATLTVTRVRSPFGHVDVSEDGRVRAFDEKPWLAQPVNIGFLVLSAQARSRLSSGSRQLEEDLLPELAAEGRLSAYVHDGRFKPMDTIADLERLDTLWRGGDLDWLPDPIASPSPVTTGGRGIRRRLAGRLAAGQVDAQETAAPAIEPVTALDESSLSAFYDSVSAALDATPLGEWSRFLNYGYADSPDERAVVDVPPGTLDQASVKLVLELVGDHDLHDRQVLDVGSGRGGTIATLLEHYSPRAATGVELSQAAVSFSRRSVGDRRATFVVGDAQRLPIATASFDVVTNVESAHCYPDVVRFHAEVRRVLAPRGTFLYTDILPTDSLAWRQADLLSLGFDLEVERDITTQVLRACDSIAQRRQTSFDTANDATLRNFLAVEGSPTYEAMRNGTSTYVIWRLRRPPGHFHPGRPARDSRGSSPQTPIRRNPASRTPAIPSPP